MEWDFVVFVILQILGIALAVSWGIVIITRIWR